MPFGVDERLLISRDITQLEAVARMRRDFIANVSHELKTPLTVVSGFLETLQDLELEPRQRDALPAADAASRRRAWSGSSTTCSRCRRWRASRTCRPRRPSRSCRCCASSSAEAKALSDGAARDRVEPGRAGATVTGSRDELASAFGNLVSNAIRYTPCGRHDHARAGASPEDGDGEFSVADTGIGIAPEHVPRLTERFYRVDRSRSRATGGTGLGLAIVKHVLLRHQAELDIASEPGKGSTFTVRIPARRVEWRCPPRRRGAPVYQ